ncbi:hypothetical protein [Halobacillus sp. A5]|uniref:hypothetical protein n=1 Tax=Halobacillus sp. A5 TaxID=2880263 RepID=UPI0020A66248|nr:hypothetical protein [Halobacillus sp. A5]MCP3027695.1 hypothetical protein [Halobacillus sp. A5]
MFDPSNEPDESIEFKANHEVTVYEFYFWGEGLIGEKYKMIAVNEQTSEERTFSESLISANPE